MTPSSARSALPLNKRPPSRCVQPCKPPQTLYNYHSTCQDLSLKSHPSSPHHHNFNMSTYNKNTALVLHPPHPPHKFEDIRPQLENTSYIIAFTDGSLQEQRAGCAVLMHRTQHHSNTQIPNTEQGPPHFPSTILYGRSLLANSYAAELSAFILALEATPEDAPLHIISDSLTGLHTLQLILEQRLPPSYKLPMAFLLNKLLTLIALRTSHTALTWVHSHQQHTSNDAVDTYAKKATNLPQPSAPLPSERHPSPSWQTPSR